MKLAWSKILIFAMIAFIVFIVAMGIKMATSSQSLYEVDYYEKGEDHSARMNLEREAEKVQFHYIHQENKVQFEFDSLGYVEEIRLVNLANSKLDRNLIIQNKSEQKDLEVSLGNLSNGIWVLEIKGLVNKKPFFLKNQIVK